MRMERRLRQGHAVSQFDLPYQLEGVKMRLAIALREMSIIGSSLPI